MTPAELLSLQQRIADKHAHFAAQIDNLNAAPLEVESDQPDMDAYAEALFLRAFTTYESTLEALFFHYVTGGASLQGAVANTYLKVTEEAAARRLVRAGWKFVSWAKPETIKQTATTYIQNGWPLSDMMSGKTQDLADCEKVRNRIAHNSLEAAADFAAVQRNLLSTERLFEISPGQLLRIRHRTAKKLHISHYVDVMNETLEAILDPPP